MLSNRLLNLSLLFKGLANTNRLKILEYLMEKDMNVTELSIAVGVPQSNMSHNLRILRECGLVSVQRFGKIKIVSVNRELVSAFFHIGFNHLHKIKLGKDIKLDLDVRKSL